jgi:SAM-dependent methyltransferase
MTATARQLWELGGYARIGDILANLGTELIGAAGVGPGQRVLDIAAGTGNATLPAARRGARVTATDIAPALMAVGGAAALQEGLTVGWIEADATKLPFDDGEFDVVMSCIGAIFVSDHTAAANEILRVCRPGGTIAMANWTPRGSVGRFFQVLGRHTPPPSADAPVPLSWGDPAYVAKLLGPGCDRLQSAVRQVPLRFDGSPEELTNLYKTHFGPVIATYSALDGDPTRAAALDADLLGYFRSEDAAPHASPGRHRYSYEYLEVIGTRAHR